MPNPEELAQAQATTNQAIRALAARSEARARAQRATNQAAARTIQAHDGRLNAAEHRLDTQEVQIADIATGLDATDELYDRLAGRLDMVATSHEIVAINVDRHDQQLATHDEWFVALFEHVGPRIMWAYIFVVSFVIGLISGIYSYFWIFEKYGLDKTFNVKGVEVLVTGDPARSMLVSAAVGLALACLLACLLSFVLIRPHSDNPPAAAEEEAAADEAPANAPGAPPAPPQGGVPAPLPPAPAPSPPAPVPAPQPVV